MCDPDCGSGDDVRYEDGGGDAGSGEKESGWRGGVGGSTGSVLSDGHGSECVAVMLAFELRWLDVVQDVVPGSRYATISRLGGGATCGETCVMLS